jgi:hypothetical protein
MAALALQFPWEDHRRGAPGLIRNTISRGLRDWAESGGDKIARKKRAAITAL